MINVVREATRWLESKQTQKGKNLINSLHRRVKILSKAIYFRHL